MVHLFSQADGYLSYAETKTVLKQLIEACGSTSDVGFNDLNDIVHYVDYDCDGKVTFMEFVAAFGLTESSVCFIGVDTDAEDMSLHLAEDMMQQICSALYRWPPSSPHLHSSTHHSVAGTTARMRCRRFSSTWTKQVTVGCR